MYIQYLGGANLLTPFTCTNMNNLNMNLFSFWKLEFFWSTQGHDSKQKLWLSSTTSVIVSPNPACESSVAEVLSDSGSPFCDATQQHVESYSQTASKQHDTTSALPLMLHHVIVYLLFIVRLKAYLSWLGGGGACRSDAQLKAGLWTPETLRTGALLPFRRLSEKMKKQTLMTPRMITPEISALVTVFIWNAGVFRWPEITPEKRHKSLIHLPWRLGTATCTVLLQPRPPRRDSTPGRRWTMPALLCELKQRQAWKRKRFCTNVTAHPAESCWLVFHLQ